MGSALVASSSDGRPPAPESSRGFRTGQRHGRTPMAGGSIARLGRPRSSDRSTGAGRTDDGAGADGCLTGRRRSLVPRSRQDWPGREAGGQKPRLFTALALLNDPEIVILGELSAGLDPRARRTSWGLVRDIRDAGKAVILVSHVVDEVEAPRDRIAVIDRRRVTAPDSPANLGRTVGGTPRVGFPAPVPDRTSAVIALLERGDLTLDEVAASGERGR